MAFWFALPFTIYKTTVPSLYLFRGSPGEGNLHKADCVCIHPIWHCIYPQSATPVASTLSATFTISRSPYLHNFSLRTFSSKEIDSIGHRDANVTIGSSRSIGVNLTRQTSFPYGPTFLSCREGPLSLAYGFYSQCTGRKWSSLVKREFKETELPRDMRYLSPYQMRWQNYDVNVNVSIAVIL